jgi:hypothetical protein
VLGSKELVLGSKELVLGSKEFVVEVVPAHPANPAWRVFAVGIVHCSVESCLLVEDAILIQRA